MNIKKNTLYAAMFSAMVGIVGCSSGSDSSNTTAANVTGRITGFGSVYVDDVEYETIGTNIMIDGVPATEDDLKVGMLVHIEGSDDGKNGNATSISFNDEVEGVVTQTVAGGGLEVMGLAITTDGNTNIVGVADIADLVEGDEVEISGYPDGNGGIHATFIEFEGSYNGSDEIEVKGMIANLTATTFDIGAMTVNYETADTSEAGSLMEGMYVEVKAASAPDPVTGILTATKIELENGGDYGINGDEGEDLEIEGMITAIDTVSTPNTITINGQTFEVPEGLDISGLSVGDIIDIDIKVVNGEPTMTEYQDEHHDNDVPGKIEVSGIATATDTVNNTITVAGITIFVSPNSTMMMDHSDSPEHYFNLGSIVEGVDRVEVDAIPNEAGDGYVAINIERSSSTSGIVSIEGTVSIDESGDMSIAGIALDIAINSVSVPGGVVDGSKIKVNGELNEAGALVVTTLVLDD